MKGTMPAATSQPVSTSAPAGSVSVVIPAYNASAYVGEAVDSVLRQTRPPDEVIVVDDGSTDDTAEVARRYGSRVTVLTITNGGPAKARNAGAAAARGDWLAFLDADDTWAPHKLEHQLSRVPPDAAIVYSDRTNFGVLDGLPVVQSEVTRLREGDLFETLLLEGNMLTASSVVIRRSVFAALHGFAEDPLIAGCEDWDLWIRVAERHTIVALSEPLVQYRVHGSSLSRNFARMNRARELTVRRGLSLPRGRRLSLVQRRRIWAATFRSNGWDAGRSTGGTVAAISAYVRSIVSNPFHGPAYMGLLRVALGRS